MNGIFTDLIVRMKPPKNWISYEETPSEGSEAPIALHFYWVDLEEPPLLSGGLDEFLQWLPYILITYLNNLDPLFPYTVTNLLNRWAANPASGGTMKVIPYRIKANFGSMIAISTGSLVTDHNDQAVI
jgi:hypothetical protein